VASGTWLTTSPAITAPNRWLRLHDKVATVSLSLADFHMRLDTYNVVGHIRVTNVP